MIYDGIIFYAEILTMQNPVITHAKVSVLVWI
jgi:hypothetical protein